MPKTNKNIGSKNSRIWITGIFVITLFGGYLYQQGSSPLNALANPPSPAEIEQGKKLFAQNCSSCHGVQPPVFGPPFKLVSGDAFSAPSAVLPKVQEVDNSELNVV